MSALEPGLYRANVRGVPDLTILVADGGITAFTCAPINGNRVHRVNGAVTDARPLIILDLRCPADVVAALRKADLGWDGRLRNLDDIADQIEAQTKPPRIPEPGLWAIVKACARDTVPRFGDDVEPRLWVHDDDDRADGWLALSDGNVTRVDFRFLIDPTLVRDGIES